LIEKKLVKNIDYMLILAIILLVCISIAVLSSATHAPDTGDYGMVKRQIMWGVISLVVGFIIITVDYNTVGNFAYFIYIGSILFLLLVKIPGIGVVRGGARSWIDLGVSSIQPSEFAKIGIIISFAKFLETREDKLDNIKGLIMPLLFVGFPAMLVFFEPDLGGTLVFMAIFAGMIFAAGISYRLILWGIISCIAAIPPAWVFLFEEHQKTRLLVFLNPGIDPLGGGYHVIQSMIAVGSGRLLGKGLHNGTQNKLDFLPEQHTDFIFSVLGEELGFIGAIIVIFLLFFILYRILDAARQAKDRFGYLVVIGVLSMLTFQIVENIGMTIGVMPITGLTLPFVSYGGSSLLANMIAIGMVISVGMRRQRINF
jgi:rod shape determining protein RodA